MKKLWTVLTLLVLLAMIPGSAMAAVPVFYCSDTALPGGDGSFDDPWSCKNAGELEDVVAEVCGSGYAILYQIADDGYYRHVIEDPADGPCKVSSTVYYRGVPPDTGLPLPLPVMIGGVLLLGAALVSGGFWLRKRTA
jgi:hypothetical protein